MNTESVKRKHTRRTRSRQRWCLMSRRRSKGSPLRMVSSSTPLVVTHLYRSYLRTLSFISRGSCLWCIHCSVSVRRTLHSSSRAVEDWRYVCLPKAIQTISSLEEFKWCKKKLSTTYLHIAYEQCKKHQAKNRDNYGETDLSDIGRGY